MKWILVLVTVVLFASEVSADTLSRKEVDRRLRTNFKTAESFRLTGMKENYWGLYRTYHVTFNVGFERATYHVGCDLEDRRPRELDLKACETMDGNGQKVSDTRARELGIGGADEVARLNIRGGRASERMPASVFKR